MKMITKIVHAPFAVQSPSLVLPFATVRKRSSRRPMEAIPTSPRRKGPTPLRTLPLALVTRELVGFHYSARPPPASTLVSAPGRSR